MNGIAGSSSAYGSANGSAGGVGGGFGLSGNTSGGEKNMVDMIRDNQGKWSRA